MELELTADQVMLRDTLRRYVAAQVAPQARAWDRDAAFPRAVVGELAEMGMLGVEVGAHHGGSELGAGEMALVIEELARGDGGLALTVAAHSGLCVGHIRLLGNDEQRDRLLPRLASGESLGAGSPVASHVPTGVSAARDGDTWVLNGAQGNVTNGGVADTCVVLAVTDPAKDRDGVTAFVVPTAAAGLTRSPSGAKLGARSADTASLQLDDVRVADADRLGEAGRGCTGAGAVLDRVRINAGALALGLGQSALAAARRYALERRQFGKPIARFQAIQWQLADAATELDAARLLVYRAASACDAGRTFAREAAMAASFAARAATRAADHAIQIHGGMGYTAEVPVERYYRDALYCAADADGRGMVRETIARSVLDAAG